MSAPTDYRGFAQLVTRRVENSKQPSHIKFAASDQGLRDTIQSAIREHGRARPLLQTKTIAGDDTSFEFILNDQAGFGWVSLFSGITELRIEDTDASELHELKLFEDVDYEVTPTLDTPHKDRLRLLRIVPATTQLIKITYTRLHLVDDTAMTIPESDLDAVVSLCASKVCDQFAMRAASDVNTATGEESTLSGASSRYTELAEKFRDAWSMHVFGNTDGKKGAVGTAAQWLPKSKVTGSRPVAHHVRRRGA